MKLILLFIPIVTCCNILSMSGGGAFGAIEIGILDELVSTKQIPPFFDVITGISAGGLNAGILSFFNDIPTALPNLIDMYSTIRNSDIYYVSINNWSIYNNSPLEKTLNMFLQLLSIPKYPPVVIIGATNLYTEELDIFVVNNMSLSEKIDILMSTTAIPIIFPPRKYNNTLYVDGGLISNEIINQVMGFIDCNYYNITYISARPKHDINNITNVVSYISALIRTLFTTFDSQLAQMTKCAYPKGEINACFPTDPVLGKFNMLDFDHGKELYVSGKRNHKCIKYSLC